jgi:hypothetical protein
MLYKPIKRVSKGGTKGNTYMNVSRRSANDNIIVRSNASAEEGLRHKRPKGMGEIHLMAHTEPTASGKNHPQKSSGRY